MGRSLGVTDSSYCQQAINFDYISSLVTQKIYVASRRVVVVDIRGVPRVAGTGGACSVQFFKSISGQTVANGVLLHSGTYDLTGTADVNQVLTLVTNPDSLILNPGDSIGYVLTGTATSAVGTFAPTVEPY